MPGCHPVFLKATVNEMLMGITGEDLGYQPMSSAQENESALHQWETWWQDNAEGAVWDSETRQLRLQQ